ncbi:hypothetical protein [Actinoplanes sp. NPDC051859]|uniref:hypothetical protein n=1 Tax=Actinoplanes sp. NPDC051859 TaxID=3363909 RepID=UPI00379DE1A7
MTARVHVWTAHGYAYLTLGVRADNRVPSGVIELPPGEAHGIADGQAVCLQAVFKDEDGRFTFGDPTVTATAQIRAAALPPGAVLHSSTAAALGAEDGGYVRLRPATLHERRARPAIQVVALSVIVGVLAQFMALMLELDNPWKWIIGGACLIATALLGVRQWRLQRDV